MIYKNVEFSAIVTKRKNYRERDMLVTMFTDKYGFKTFFVRGVRKRGFKLGAAILPFTHGTYIGSINSEGLSFITATKGIDQFQSINQDIILNAYATYILDKEATCTQTTICCQNIKILSKYLYFCCYAFKSLWFHFTGAAIPQITVKQLNKNLVPLPPLEEQEKIVKKIEELFELIDKKEKNNKEKEKLKTLLKEKILDSAIHGKLVENDLSLPAIDIEEVKEDIPFDVPINWKWSYIENCVQINPRNKINDEIIVGFVPMTNILGGYESKIVFESKKWKYVKKGYTHIKTDDVIVAKITPCFENRKSAYIKHLPSGYGAGTTEIHVLRNINNKMYMKYLLWFVKTNYFIKDGQNHFTGTAGQQRISKQWLSKFLIPVPPLEQQKKIVEKIEECFKLIEQL